MVDLVPKVAINPGNNYFGYTEKPSPPQSDQTWGTLFSGIGNLFEEGVSGEDTVLKHKADLAIHAGVDSIQNKAGVDLTPENAPFLAGTGGSGRGRMQAVGIGQPDATGVGPGEVVSEPPPGVKAGIGQIQELNAANAQGKLSNTYYYTNLQQMVKGIRAQYPGYRDYIDDQVKGMTGINPANALRASILNDYTVAASAAAAAGDKTDQFIRSNAGIAELVAPGSTDPNNSKGYDKAQVQVAISQYLAQDQKLNSEKLRLSTIKERNSGTSDDAMRVFTSEADHYVGSIFKGAMNAGGTGLANIQRDLSDPGKLTPERIQQIGIQIDQMISQTEVNLNARASAPLADGKSDSYNTMISDPAKVQAVISQATAGLKAVKATLGLEKPGLAGAAANIAQMTNDDRYKQLITGSNGAVFSTLGNLSKILGPAGQGVFESTVQQSNILPPLVKAVHDTVMAGMATPDGKSPPGVTEVLNMIKTANGSPSGTQNRMTTDNLLKMATSGDTEMAVKAAQSLYGDEKFLPSIKESEAIQVLNRLASPDVTEKMYQLGQKDPTGKTWQNYQNFLQNGLQLTAQTAANSVQNLLTDPTLRNLNLHWNPKSFQFESALPGNQAGNHNEMSPVNTLNSAIRLMLPVLQKTHADPSAAIQDMLSAMRVNPSAPKQQTFFQNLSSLVGKAVDGVANVVGPGPEFKAVTPTPVPSGEKFSFMKDPSFMEVASKYVGLNEVDHASVLSSFFKKSAGISIDPGETAWCAAFVNSVLGASGAKGTGSLMAKSFLNYGTEATNPTKGDIVVLSRGASSSPYGHVGFVQSVNKDGTVSVLGGNQGNAVSIEKFPASKVLGYRHPPTASKELNGGDADLPAPGASPTAATMKPNTPEGFFVPTASDLPDSKGNIGHGRPSDFFREEIPRSDSKSLEGYEDFTHNVEDIPENLGLITRRLRHGWTMKQNGTTIFMKKSEEGATS